jgi:PAS domain S-box-containing protein
VRDRNQLEELEKRTKELASLNQALKKSEERFRFLVQQVKDYAIVYLDAEGCVVSWNEGAEQIYGCRPEEALGKHLSIFHPGEGIEHRDPWRMLELATAEGQFKGEGWRLRGDKSHFWADVVITALRNESGLLQGFAVVTRNIDERRKAEEALDYRLAMEELVITISNRFINVPPDALDDEIGRALEAVRNFTSSDRSYLCLLSEGLAVTSLYESLSSRTDSRAPKLETLSLESLPWLLGELKKGEAVALSDIADLPSEATAEKEYWRATSPVRALVLIPMNIGQSLRGYLALNSDEHGKRWASEDVKLLRIAGQIFAACLERRQSEEKQRGLELKILEGQRREVEMRQRENDRWIALGHMASGIAHDIRNPINFVSLALEYLSERKSGGQKEKPKAHELFADAHSELLRVNEMIQGLLDFGKAQTLDLQVENASEVLTQSRDEVIRRHQGHELHLSLEGTDSPFPILADHGLLLRALVNLFENALEAGGPTSPVRGGVSRKKGDAILWLEDSGPGIEVENLGKIFTPYFTTKKAGIGLGLTLTRKWVDEMGGKIRACNVPAGGARFELSFPIAAGGLRNRKEKKRTF